MMSVSATSPDADAGAGAGDAAGKLALADPIAEARRVLARAGEQGVMLRVLGGVAVFLQSPAAAPLLSRKINDIDVVTTRAGKRAMAGLFSALGYTEDEVFNAFHGNVRQVYVDEVNRRKVDVFVGAFSMCHEIPIAERLDREPLTVPLAELLLTKLQIVELTERDERDIYNLCFHHELSAGDGPGIEAGVIAGLCSQDWGLWRTCKGTIEHCRGDLGSYELADDARATIDARLVSLWERIEQAPKTSKWRWRARVGDRVRWYEEPEEEGQTE
jgi:hypothetical protein